MSEIVKFSRSLTRGFIQNNGIAFFIFDINLTKKTFKKI